MGPPPDDHDCGWKTRATDLEAKLEKTAAKFEELATKMAAMERRILGPKSEKLPPIDREVRKERPADPAETLAARRKNAELGGRRRGRAGGRDFTEDPEAEQTRLRLDVPRGEAHRVCLFQ